MSYVEAFELFRHLKSRIEIGDEVITSDLVLSPQLVHDELRVTVGLKVPYSKLVRELQANEQGIVFCDVVDAGLDKRECARNDVVSERNEDDSNPSSQSPVRDGSRCSIEVHLPNRMVCLSGMRFSGFI